MSRLMRARILLAAVGVVVWGYGYRVGDSRVTLGAIAILAVALLLRFGAKR